MSTVAADAIAPIKSAEATTAGVQKVPLIPIRKRRYGPLVLRRRWRLFTGWGIVFAASWLLLASSLSPSWNAFALGLMFPGAGFLYDGSILGAGLAVVALLVFFPGSFINWFGSGMISAPLGAWLGGAALSAWFVGSEPMTVLETVTPFAAMSVLVGWAVINRVSFWKDRAQAKQYNEEFAKEVPMLKEIPAYKPGPELSQMELAVTRHHLNKALQPLSQWEGYGLTEVDQWQPRATRYQTYFDLWKIGQVAMIHTPSFLGYSRDAMRNLILKNLDKRIWDFWVWENLWGNFELNPDPIRRDNIMVTGFLANMIGVYQTLTGDKYFDQPGSMTYWWNDKTSYSYDYESIVGSLHRNYQRYDINWMPCEPGLVYSMCNNWGFTGVKMFDRLRGENKWEQIRARVEQSFEEEMLHPDGRICALMFTKAGLQAPTLSSVVGECSSVMPMIGVWPEKAERLWQVIRRKFLVTNPDGSVEIKLVPLGWDKYYATNFYVGSQTPAMAEAILLSCAIQMGDTEVADAVSRHIDQKFGPEATAAIKLGERKAIWYDMVVRGLPEEIMNGPVLAEAKFEEVQVARAVSDGKDLELVLRPAGEAVRARLDLGRLVPGSRYAVSGAIESEVTADSLGAASIVVDLHDRLEVRVTPAS